MAFKAPNGAEDYIERVSNRVRDLIDAGLWDIPLERMVGWFSGFTTIDERYFAACLLDSLVYRSPTQFSACITSLFGGPCSLAVQSHLRINDDVDLIKLLRDKFKDPGVRLVPVICDSDPPSKSGPLVIRRIKKQLGIADRWMIWPSQIGAAVEAGAKVIILVDDLLGSGKQAEGFCKKQQVREMAGKAKVIYAPVVAHEKGIEHLSKFWPELTVISAEKLTEDHHFFSQKTWDFLSDGQIKASDAEDFYIKKMLPLTGFVPGKIIPATGVGELALCFGFSHSTPNNSLPILWFDREGWCSLLER